MNRNILYRTPAGTFTTPEEAEAACERMDMDYNSVVEVLHMDPPHYVGWEFGPGGVLRLSHQVRVF